MHLGQSLALSELFPHRYGRNASSPSELALHGNGMRVEEMGMRSELDLAYHPIERQFTNLSSRLKVTRELRLIRCYLGRSFTQNETRAEARLCSLRERAIRPWGH